MTRLAHVALLMGLTLSIGCIDFSSKPAAEQKQAVAENKPAADDGKGIIGKTTQEIGKFDPNVADQVVSDQKVHATDPITAGLSTYGPAAEKIAMLRITNEINTFEAIEQHYPTYEEFMERIIKANNIQLPVLPYKGRYMYDEEKHALVVVRDRENAEKAK